jgi:hypothetical protein
MRKLITLSLLSLYLYSNSIEKIEIGFKSYHLKPLSEYKRYKYAKQKEFNEDNLGVFIKFKNNLQIGAFKNSFNNTSLTIGYWNYLYKRPNYDITYSIGVVSGYRWIEGEEDFFGNETVLENTESDLVPIVSLEFRYEYLKVALIPLESPVVYSGLVYKF